MSKVSIAWTRAVSGAKPENCMVNDVVVVRTNVMRWVFACASRPKPTETCFPNFFLHHHLKTFSITAFTFCILCQWETEHLAASCRRHVITSISLCRSSSDWRAFERTACSLTHTSSILVFVFGQWTESNFIESKDDGAKCPG